MSAGELAGLRRVYAGLMEGTALMPDDCVSLLALAPLITDLAWVLAHEVATA